MEVLNLAATALFDSLTRHSFDQELLLKGTHLKLNYMLDVKKKHSWIEFVKMYENAAELLGPNKAAREIAYHGIYSENLSTLRKVATGLLDTKTIYWFLGTVGCRHLFKDTVKFKYQKINSNQVKMEISISPELEDCPLLLETYIYLFENVPTALGLPKASVSTEFSRNKAIYTIKLVRTSYLKYLFFKFTRSMTGYTNAVLLMEELETQSLQLSKLLEEKSELLRIMSHDISNSVAMIDMSLVQVLRKGTLHEDDRIALEKTKKSSDRLCDILRNVQKLEVAHIRGVNLEPVDVDHVFATVEDYFRDQLSLKNIRLVLQNNLPGQVKVIAEKSSLELNVLVNLVSNAIKFSNYGSVIILEADMENGQIAISVADQGRGMSLEERKGLFTTKIRKSTIGTNGEVGTGFGLGIVNTYVKLYGGRITVNQNFPTGTIIKISLHMHVPQFSDTIHRYGESHHTNITTRN